MNLFCQEEYIKKFLFVYRLRKQISTAHLSVFLDYSLDYSGELRIRFSDNNDIT